MNKKYMVMLCWAALSAPGAFAQDVTNPMDATFPIDMVPMFDPSNPLAGSTTPIVPPTPQLPNINQTIQQNDTGDVAFPGAVDRDEFEFMQPGHQIGQIDDEVEEAAPEEVIEIEPEKAPVRRRKLPLVRFNYKNQRMPYPIYSRPHRAENSHLPPAMYQLDYDVATFAAAARNDINGLRAMLNAGRNIHMRNAYGESLVQVAARHGANDTLRFLIARGANTGGAVPNNTQAVYALRAAHGH